MVMTRGDMPKGLTYYRKGGAASKKAKAVRFALRVKRGQKEPLTHTLRHMPTWPLLSIVKTLTMPKAVRRKANG